MKRADRARRSAFRLTGAVLAVLVLLSALSGCGPQVEQDESKVQVVSTLFPYYDFARQIGGDRVEVTLLLSPGRESHSFEPTPLDVIRISEADVFLYNGGEGEVWVDETMDAYDAPDQVVCRMMDYVDVLEEELVEGMEAEGGHDHDHEDHEEDSDEIEYDEHIWTSPVNAKLLAQAVCDALTEADPEGADYYAANLAAYDEDLTELDEAFRQVVAEGKRDILVFGDRFPLLYFCKTYGLRYRAAFQGCSSDTEPSVKTLAYLIDKINEEHIPVVYHLELSSEAITNVICESTGAKSLQFHSCHNLSREDFEQGATYLSLMWQNVEALKEGLA